MKISELVQGMKRANILGKVLKVNPVREFNKNGREGKVASLLVADESSNIRVVLWDTNHISLIENGKIAESSTIEISNASVRNGELHLSAFSDIKISKEKLTSVIEAKVFSSRKLKDARPGETVKTRAFIINSFEPRYFEVCPDCGKRVTDNECKVHGQVQGIKRALLSIILDDGTESMRSVLFGEQINLLGLTTEEIFSLEKFQEAKPKLLGEELIFSGNIKNNQLYNTIEFNIESVEKINPQTLLAELESKPN